MEVEYSFHNGMVRKEQIEDTICRIHSSSSDEFLMCLMSLKRTESWWVVVSRLFL